MIYLVIAKCISEEEGVLMCAGTYSLFEEIEKEYKLENLTWGSYSFAIDWDIVDNRVNVFVKNTDSRVIRANLNRVMSHELRDLAIVNVLKKLRVNNILDIGADTGMFLAICKCNGINGVGIEPNKEAVEYVNKKNFVRLFCFDWQSLATRFKNNGIFDMCSMMNTYHGKWPSLDEKERFTKYLSENFRYVILSDDFKGHKSDPMIAKYFKFVYDFNMFGMSSLKNIKQIRGPFKKIKKYLNKQLFRDRENQIFEKMHILSLHKLYISRQDNI